MIELFNLSLSTRTKLDNQKNKINKCVCLIITYCKKKRDTFLNKKGTLSFLFSCLFSMWGLTPVYSLKHAKRILKKEYSLLKHAKHKQTKKKGTKKKQKLIANKKLRILEGNKKKK